MVLVNERVVKAIFSAMAEYSAIAIPKGKSFVVNGVCPNTEALLAFAYVQIEKKKGTVFLWPKFDLIGVTSGLHESLLGTRDLFSIRADRQFTGGTGVSLARENDWEKLAPTIPHATVKNIYHQDLRRVLVLVYEDEVRRARGC